MKANLKPAEHWELYGLAQDIRASEAEMQLLSARYEQLNNRKEQQSQKWREAIKRIGKRVKAKGDLERWEFIPNDNPEKSILQWPDEAKPSSDKKG